MKLAEIFSDHMVLQRRKPICLFGEGEGVIKVELNGFMIEAESRTQSFRVYLPPMEAGGPYTMTVTLNGEETVYSDILIGDVYLAGGQSNMQFTLVNEAEYAENLRELPRVRYFLEPHDADIECVPCYDYRGWQLFTPENEPTFSAVAYYTAIKLAEYTDVPLGIVSVNKGASRVDAWTDPKIVAEPSYQEMIASRHNDYNYFKFNIDSWLFTNKLLPIVPFANSGVLWYQGESNAYRGEGGHYTELFRIMVENWRHLFGDQLPFYTIQIMPFAAAEENDWPAVRACQAEAAMVIPGVRLVTLFDTGEADAIHPIHKKALAEALASAVICDRYGKYLPYCGPVIEKAERVDDGIRLSFRYADGLCLKGGVLTDTYGITADGTTIPLTDCVIDGASLTLKTADSSITAVSMGYQNVPVHSLYNTDGFWASPFRVPVIG